MYIKILCLIGFITLANAGDVGVITQTCERTNLNLECREGYVLKILSANYGRVSREVCTGGDVYSTACFSVQAPHVVSYSCNGKKRCSIGANNGMFGDPCIGTYKYLEVESTCIPVH